MSNRERSLERAAWLLRKDIEEVGSELRTSRLMAGLTLEFVGRRVGVAGSTILRRERGRVRSTDTDSLARHAAAVGMRIRVKAYPEGAPLRDAAQVQLIRDFRARVPRVPMQLERYVTTAAGDRRAFDATLELPGGCAVEFITRFHDCQAQLRQALLKQRDAGLARLIIVVKASHANRRAVAAAADLIETTFPIGTKAALAALAKGDGLAANALIAI